MHVSIITAKQKLNCLQAGFSLIEVMLALGMAGVVGLGAAYVVQSQVVTQKTVATKMDLNGVHAIALQQARNLEFIARTLSIPTTPATNAVDKKRQQCMAGNTAMENQCSSFSIEDKKYEMVKSSTTGEVVSTITPVLYCGSDSCSKVEVTVRTQMALQTSQAGSSGQGSVNSQASQSPSIKNRIETKLEFPSMAFVPTEQLNMDCGTALPTSVNMGRRSAECDKLMSDFFKACSASGNEAMLNFGDAVRSQEGLARACSKMRSRACRGTFNEAGVAVIGAGAEAIQCRGLASLAPPTPTPAPTPPTPTPVPTAAPTPLAGSACSDSVIYLPCRSTACNSTDFTCSPGQVIDRFRIGNLWSGPSGRGTLISWIGGGIASLCIPAGTGSCSATEPVTLPPVGTPTPAPTAAPTPANNLAGCYVRVFRTSPLGATYDISYSSSNLSDDGQSMQVSCGDATSSAGFLCDPSRHGSTRSCAPDMVWTSGQKGMLACFCSPTTPPVARTSCNDECGEERSNGETWCTAGTTVLGLRTSRCVNGAITHIATVSGLGCDSSGRRQCQ